MAVTPAWPRYGENNKKPSPTTTSSSRQTRTIDEQPATGLRSSQLFAVCKCSGRVLYEGSAGDEGSAVKFTVERIALERMVEQLKTERSVKGPRQRMMRLLACAARVFVEANGVAAGIEALVLEEGACNVPRIKFLKVLRTFHPKQNLTLSVDENGLRI